MAILWGVQSLKYSESDDSEDELGEFGFGNVCEGWGMVVVVVVGVMIGVGEMVVGIV